LFVLICFLACCNFVSADPMDSKCLQCLCEGMTTCDLSRGCIDNMCGAYRLSEPYWIDGKRLTLPGDSPSNPNAFPNCAKEFSCAKKTVTNYMTRYAKDCDGNGVIDCLDYAMIHVLGPFGCTSDTLFSSSFGQEFLQRFNKCINDESYIIQDIDVRIRE